MSLSKIFNTTDLLIALRRFLLELPVRRRGQVEARFLLLSQSQPVVTVVIIIIIANIERIVVQRSFHATGHARTQPRQTDSILAGAQCCQTRVQLLHRFVVLAQVLPDLRVAVLVVRDDNVAGVRGGDARLAVVLPRQVALPVLFVLPDVLDAERVAVVHEQRLAALAQHELEPALEPLFTGGHCGGGRV